MKRFFCSSVVGSFLFALQITMSGVVNAGEAKARSESNWETVVKAANV
jgi:hypothetical protein